MANTTLIQLVNRMQRRLRESQTVNVNTTSYGSLLADFVNEAKREVEDAWNWNALRTTITVNTVLGTSAYVLTGAGKRFRILDVFDDTNNTQLLPIWGTEQSKNFNGTPEQNTPVWYSFNGDSNGDPIVDFYPIPNGIYSVNFNIVVPQNDLVNNTDELQVPDYPVFLSAMMKALEERGEDATTQYARITTDYQKALSDAIAQDEARMPVETDWYAV